MTLVEALIEFRMVYMTHRSIGDVKKDFYCGITDDISGDKIKCGENDILHHVQLDSKKYARFLESMMHYDGFDTGKRMDADSGNSCIVYMFKKSKVTNSHYHE